MTVMMGREFMPQAQSPDSLFHDLDIFIGEAIELVDDLVDEPAGLLDSRQEGPERRHRVRELPAQVVLKSGTSQGRRPASVCSS